MTDVAALKKAYEESGVTITFLAKKLGCTRNKIYSIMAGSECTATDIVKMSEALHLTDEQRNKIFLGQSVN